MNEFNFVDMNRHVAIPQGLYKIVSTWGRLESRSRDDEFDQGLQARTADPLWYIARQWQFGELQAEDAGSLCYVKLEYETEKVSHYSLGKDQPYIELPPNEPLEILVEQEEPFHWTWRMRIRTGQQFERYVRETLTSMEYEPEGIENIIQGLYRDYPVELSNEDEQMDVASKRLVKMIANKTINGETLWNRRGNGLSPELTSAWENLEAWFESLFARPSSNAYSAWQSESLDYYFKTKTDRSTELASERYRNGDLEWYSFNHVSDAVVDEAIEEEDSSPRLDNPEPNRVSFLETLNISLRATDEQIGNLTEEEEATAREDRTQTLDRLVPTRVSFGGAPNARWWAMEDHKVNLADLDTAKSELINTMFIDFALIHGDDWFVIPLNLPTGSLTLIKSVTTTDVFGKKLIIDNARVNDPDPLKRWDLFSLAQNALPRENAERDYLFIPPSSGFREESEALEEVNFIRDEQANLVFGIEKTMLNGWGKPVSVLDYYLEQERLAEEGRASNEAETEPNTDDANTPPKLTYKLATKVPKNWIPYMAEKIDAQSNSAQTFLKRAKLPDVSASLEDDVFSIPEPMSRVLKESAELNEEAIPRSGLQVKLNAQRLRWLDGKTYVWVGRKVIPANRERSSGLEFDVISFINGVANDS